MELRRRRRRLAVALILGVLSSCTGSGTSSPAGTTSSEPPSPTSSVTVAAHLAIAPSGCPTSQPLLQQAPPWGALFGSAPAFGAFYAHHDPSAGSFHVGTDTVRRENGWQVKVLWVLQPTMIEPVTLSGQEVGTGSPITFDASGLNPTGSDTMRLDPSNPGTPSHRKGWSEYPSSVWFPEAGCYIIKASWADGSWQRGLGFGR
jgi:hypothetical protein